MSSAASSGMKMVRPPTAIARTQSDFMILRMLAAMRPCVAKRLSLVWSISAYIHPTVAAIVSAPKQKMAELSATADPDTYVAAAYIAASTITIISRHPFSTCFR